jgi:hypothetical protein
MAAVGYWDEEEDRTVVEVDLAALIKEDPIMVDRGGVEDPDFMVSDLTIDEEWHTLDLSEIVPAGFRWIFLACVVDGPLKKTVYVRGATKPAQGKIRGLTVQVANTELRKWFMLYVGDERTFDYAVDSGSWDTVNLYVLGWSL